MLAWWQKDDEALLNYELAELKRRGATVTRCTKDALTGSCAVSLTLDINGRPVDLEVLFPLTFPDTPIEVLLKSDIEMKHHFNPNERNLCTLEQPFTNWKREWSVAEFLFDQLPKVFEAGQSDNANAVADTEAHQAEPLFTYLGYEIGSAVLVQSNAASTVNRAGGDFSGAYSAAPPVLKITLTEFETETSGKQELVEHPWNSKLPLKGKWQKTNQSPLGKSAEAFLNQQKIGSFALKNPRWFQESNDTDFALFGFLCKDETAWREQGLAWVFIVERRNHTTHKRVGVSYIRAMYADRESMLMRLPHSAALRSASAAIIGIGCLGAPVALELAKLAIKEIHLVDPDFVEPGPTVRWPLGVNYSGDAKVSALGSFIANSYPWSKIVAFNLRFGSALGSVALETYEAVFSGASIIINSTAEQTLTWALAKIAKEREISFVSLATLPGGQSGEIIAIRSSDSVCAECIAYYQNDGTVPSPKSTVNDSIQPTGCADPTFVAASYDTSQISLAAVKIIASVIEASDLSIDENYFVVRMNDDNGRQILPEWKSYKLPPHRDCPNHEK